MADLIDNSHLAEWLTEQLGERQLLEIQRMGQDTGVGNALYDVRWGDQRLVLRRPPSVKVTASAGNTMREARVLSALAGTDVPHPRLVAVCDDPGVIGASFLLMEHIDGFTAVDPLPDGVDDPDAKRALGIEIVEGLARLALVDWQAVGLEGFGKPDGFLARQVDRWLWQLDSYRTRDLPNLDDVADWLRRNLPEAGPVGIVHGDYSMYNTMFSHDSPPRLAAIIDWDTATIGETLVDLGHLLSRWDEVGEVPTSLGSNDMADRTGLPRRHELAQRYADITCHDMSNVLYYEVLSLFKLGCIMEGHHANAIAAAAGGEVDPRFIDSAPNLLADAARIAQGRRGEI